MSKFLYDKENDNDKVIAIPRVFFETAELKIKLIKSCRILRYES